MSNGTKLHSKSLGILEDDAKPSIICRSKCYGRAVGPQGIFILDMTYVDTQTLRVDYTSQKVITLKACENKVPK